MRLDEERVGRAARRSCRGCCRRRGSTGHPPAGRATRRTSAGSAVPSWTAPRKGSPDHQQSTSAAATARGTVVGRRRRVRRAARRAGTGAGASRTSRWARRLPAGTEPLAWRRARRRTRPGAASGRSSELVLQTVADPPKDGQDELGRQRLHHEEQRRAEHRGGGEEHGDPRSPRRGSLAAGGPSMSVVGPAVSSHVCLLCRRDPRKMRPRQWCGIRTAAASVTA